MNTMAKKTEATSISLIPPISIRSLLKTKEQKYKEKCLSVIENSRIFNFMGITDITSDTVDAVVDDILSIRDDQKILLTSLLLNRWFYCKDNGVYVKHIKSNTKNVLYQIILGDSQWDGVYEFSLKGIDIESKGYEENGMKILEISSPGNYDVMLCSDASDEELSVTRFDLELDFNTYLVEKGLVTEEELNIYSTKDVLTNQYLQRTLPYIRIK